MSKSPDWVNTDRDYDKRKLQFHNFIFDYDSDAEHLYLNDIEPRDNPDRKKQDDGS
jgi:hypothetical protein